MTGSQFTRTQGQARTQKSKDEYRYGGISNTTHPLVSRRITEYI